LESKKFTNLKSFHFNVINDYAFVNNNIDLENDEKMDSTVAVDENKYEL